MKFFAFQITFFVDFKLNNYYNLFKILDGFFISQHYSLNIITNLTSIRALQQQKKETQPRRISFIAMLNCRAIIAVVLTKNLYFIKTVPITTIKNN